MVPDPRFTFLGNVCIGEGASASSAPGSDSPLAPYTYPSALHLPLTDLAPHYNYLILAYGASLSNALGVPGGELANVFPALAFVSWYNGHPAYASLPVDLTGVRAVDVVGQGNVALDVARMLLQDAGALARSDVPQHVLDVLGSKAVEEVRIVGRRGPAQVAFTTKELRELTRLPGINYAGLPADLASNAREAVKGDRARSRMLGLMEKPLSGPGPTFALDFLRSPVRFLGDDAGKVNAVEWGMNELADGGARARDTGTRETRPTDMVVEAVGYRSEPISDLLPHARGRVHNDEGRVRGAAGEIPRVYTSGWVARGPVGVIASTMQDAYGVANHVIDDIRSPPLEDGDNWLPRVPEPGRPEAVERGLKEGRVIDIARWDRIDRAERELGKKTGRDEREKFPTVEEMLAAA